MEQFESKIGEIPGGAEAPKKRLNQVKMGRVKKAEKEATERGLLAEKEKREKEVADKELVEKLDAINENFLPQYAKRIKLWLEIINLANITEDAKNKFILHILDSKELEAANKYVNYGDIYMQNMHKGLILNLRNLAIELKRKKEDGPVEIDALFENLRDDIWAFGDENKTKED